MSSNSTNTFEDRSCISKGTLWIVLKHFSSDNQKVMEKLASHPKLLFAYLKGIMDARPGGNNLSGLENAVKLSFGKHKDRLPNRQKSTSGRVEWDPNVDIRDLLRRSDVVFTDDMAELYVEVNLAYSLNHDPIFVFNDNNNLNFISFWWKILQNSSSIVCSRIFNVGFA